MKISIMYGLINLLISLSIVGNTYSKEIGGFYIGVNNLFIKNSNRYNISPQGISAGFVVPIHLMRNMDIDFKVKASHHNVENHYSYHYDHKMNYFFNVTNELLVGKSIKLKDRIKLAPQIGFGAIGEAIYYEWDRGYTHGDIFMDLSITASYSLKYFNIGILMNYEFDLLDRVSSMLSDNRFLISFIVYK